MRRGNGPRGSCRCSSRTSHEGSNRSVVRSLVPMSATPKVRIATRESQLALAQTRMVAAALAGRHAAEVELVPMTTRGDRVLDRPLAQVGGKGLFVKELEVAIEEGRAELAVHSL